MRYYFIVFLLIGRIPMLVFLDFDFLVCSFANQVTLIIDRLIV